MGKKRKTKAFVLKPWCWYCEREFEDEKVLLQHQKSKHFKCQLCPRKLNTAGGLMVHSQQVHKCEPEPLTNTLPGRDGYEIEIFGMEGVPTNALAEWKARKEQEAGAAVLASGSLAKRPRHSYTVIPEADLMAALQQHKILMAARKNPQLPAAFPPFAPGQAPPFPPGMMPPGFPPMPPPTLIPGAQPYGVPPFRPSFPPATGLPPFPAPAPTLGSPAPPRGPPPAFVAQSGQEQFLTPTPGLTTEAAVDVKPPKDGVYWPDNDFMPAEKRALQPKYRYTSPGPEDGLKRKAAADLF